ncbi:uncharacterized protein PAC_18031 [Phialocephala subalpina]|uniref:Uncharacterized protein n=1 Tax=Phialocephala subalpina TaxID=576137 RepID=A0A1L7XSW7_9HELO|nr:uncharacterized protein PAC_18031 [Phialocephala subalpina]
MVRILKTLLVLVFFDCACVAPMRQSTTLSAALGSSTRQDLPSRQVLSSNAPDPNAYYTMTTPQAGDENCLYAMLGTNGADPYPVRFESCTPLQDTALWQFTSDTKGRYFISNKGWPGNRMSINDYHETIMYMNTRNDTALQTWAVNSIDGGFELINANHPGNPMCSMPLDDGYVALILTNTTTLNSTTGKWKLVKNGVLSTSTNTSSVNSSASTTSIISSTPSSSSTSTNATGKISPNTILGIVLGSISGIALVVFFLALCNLVRRHPKITYKDALKIVFGCGRSGGFKQTVRIYKHDDPRKYATGKVLLDSGNEGPNLITTKAMTEAGATPQKIPGSSKIVVTLGEKIIRLVEEVLITFSGDMDNPHTKGRPYTKTFCHVDDLGDYDMVLNEEFILEYFPKRVPRMLMLRFRPTKKEEKRI